MHTPPPHTHAFLLPSSARCVCSPSPSYTAPATSNPTSLGHSLTGRLDHLSSEVTTATGESVGCSLLVPSHVPPLSLSSMLRGGSCFCWGAYVTGITLEAAATLHPVLISGLGLSGPGNSLTNDEVINMGQATNSTLGTDAPDVPTRKTDVTLV